MTRPLIAQPAGHFPRAPLTDDQIQEDVVTNLNEHATAIDSLIAGGGHTDFYVTPVAYGADPTGATDSRAAIITALAAARSLGCRLHFSGGPTAVYLISKYIDIAGARRLRITSDGAVIRYPSDDLSIVADAVALSDAQARSGFLMRYCIDTTLDDLVFQGGTAQAFDTQNLGPAVYETNCQNTFGSYTAYDGNSVHQQDAQANTASTGDSLSVTTGVVTLTSSAALFQAGHLGRQITIADAANLNNGVFVITAVVSSTVVKFTNAAAVNETSSFHWEIDDGDRGTVLFRCHSERCRGVLTVPSHSRVLECSFRQPLTPDVTGIPLNFSKTSNTVTLTAANGAWTPAVVGRYILIQGSTTVGNDGLFQILTATTKTRFAPATLTYTNASGATELGDYVGAVPSTFWIPGGEKSGIGAGSAALAISGSVVTLTAATTSFSSEDIGKIIRIAGATTAGNNGAFVITAATATTVDYTNANGASETFANVWSLDGHDAGGNAGAAYGSTHAMYVFAGREDIEVTGCTFQGVRKNCVKASGSVLPIRGINVHHNTMIQCGGGFSGGADDANEHTSLHFDSNTLIDVATGRPGWGEAVGVSFLGSKNGTANANSFHYTQPAVPAADFRATQAGLICIQAARYSSGKTQPLEDFSARGNKATADRVNTLPLLLNSAMINVQECGIVNHWGGSGATFTKSGSVITLTDTTAAWSQDLTGSKIQIVGATTGGNNGTFTVTGVTGVSTLTYANGSGATEAFPLYAAYRIKRLVGARGGLCDLTLNECDGAAVNVFSTVSNVGMECQGTVANGCVIGFDSGSRTPRFSDCRLISPATSNAGLQVGTNTTFPLVYNNTITGGDLAAGSLAVPESPAAIRGDVGIGIGSFTRVDHPLLGKSGRLATPTTTLGHTELMIGFGSLLVEGDAFNFSGINTLVYTDDPAAAYPKFHTQAQLISCLTHTLAGADYGERFATPMTTGHIVAHKASTSADAFYIDSVNVLNPTALVIPRNDTAGGESIQYSRGEADGGPLAYNLPIWSPLVGFGCPILTADNAASAAVTAGGYFMTPAAKNTGAVGTIHTLTANTDGNEFRWYIP